MWRLVGQMPVRRSMLAAVSVATAFALLPAPASASSDYDCSPDWTLKHPDATGCDNMAALGPGNDTRVNLALLLGGGLAPTSPPSPDLPRADPMFDWATFQRRSFPKPADLGDEGYAAGEGSRCRSDKPGAAAFAEALGQARGVTAMERDALIAARAALQPTCTDAGTDAGTDTGTDAGTDAGTGAAAIAAAAGQVRSTVAQAFAGYLAGVSSFYAGDFPTATARLQTLAASEQPWLRETARYMLGRIEVNRAQVGLFDEYGYHDPRRTVDPAIVTAAETRLRDYLRGYPHGRYAASARGLLRRVYWLGGDTAKLADEYVALFAQGPARRDPDDAALAEEIDNKLLPQLTAADTTDPILLAVIDLRAMRRGADGHAARAGDGSAQALPTRAALLAQRPRFARAPALFEFLQAAHAFHVAGTPHEVLALIPDASRAPSFDNLQFSRQVLRGMALDALRDAGARPFWLALLPGAAPGFQRVTIELALALHDERNDGLDRVFAAGSPVRHPAIRDILLTNVAGASLLRRQADDAAIAPHERAVALFTLLYKDLTRDAYADFVTDLRRLPPDAAAGDIPYEFVGGQDPPVGIFIKGTTADDFACPALRDTAGTLAKTPRDARAQLCLAEFVRLNSLDDFVLDTQPKTDQLGGTPSRFVPAKSGFSRLETYKAVITAHDTAAADRAYALFRAVNCYAPSGNDQCGGTDVPLSVRKGWFQRLHTDYPASRWAIALKYYW